MQEEKIQPKAEPGLYLLIFRSLMPKCMNGFFLSFYCPYSESELSLVFHQRQIAANVNIFFTGA